MLRKKVEANEREIFEMRNKLIERQAEEEERGRGREKGKGKEKGNRCSVSPDLKTSVVTKKNLVNLKNDLQNFKNEMRRSLSANESGVRERLNSISRSILHMTKAQEK